jgi:fibronectin type 3 domain-containing protein
VLKSSSSSSLSSDFDIVDFYSNNSPFNFSVSATSNSATVINLTWDAMPLADFYRIERKEGFSDWEFLDDKVDSPYVDIDVFPGKYYSYRISAIGTIPETGNQIQSLFSTNNYIIFTPVTPSNLDVKLINGMSRLSWSDNSTYENGFIIKRKYNDGEYDVIYSSVKNNSFFVDSGPFLEGEYTYKVNSFVVLSDQTRLDSPDSNEASIEITIDKVENDSNGYYIDFAEESNIEVVANSIFKVTILNTTETDYFWFADNDNIILGQFGNYAYISAMKVGDSVVKVRDSFNSEAVLNVSIINKFNFNSPSHPVNVLPITKSESFIEISWNYIGDDIEDISHFDIYRLPKVGTNSANTLINQNDLSINRVNSISNKMLNIFSFIDYGLQFGQSYFYTVVAVGINGKTSLFKDGKYVSPEVIEVSTMNNNLSINPSQVFVDPVSTYLLQAVSTEELSSADWGISSNNSNSSLLETDSNQNVIFESTDKWISKDIVEVNNDGVTASSRIIITKMI